MTTKVQLRIVNIKQFEADTQKASILIDELSAAALALINGGPMAYTQFIQIRDDFKNHVKDVAKDYRTIEIF